MIDPIDPACWIAENIKVAGNDVSNNPVDLTGVTISTNIIASNTIGEITFDPALPDYCRFLVRLDDIFDADVTSRRTAPR